MGTSRAWTRLQRLLDASDLELLLKTEPSELLGCILNMNRAPRYQNRLDAVLLTIALLELRADPMRSSLDGAHPVSSPDHPASSD